jgi:hypothetical protein
VVDLCLLVILGPSLICIKWMVDSSEVSKVRSVFPPHKANCSMRVRMNLETMIETILQLST